MHFIFYFLLCFQLTSLSLFAASYEINMAELFPQQNLIQKIQVEAEHLQAHVTLISGQKIDALYESQLPQVSDIAQISVMGPEVKFKVTTQSGNEWTRSMSSFNLQISNLIINGRSELAIELYATPFNKIVDLNNENNTQLNFASYLFKSLVLGAQGDMHFKLQVSGDSEGKTHPSINLEMELSKQHLFFESHHLQDGLIKGAWKIQGNGFGKGSLVDIIISAIKMMSEENRKIVLENLSEYDLLLKNIFYGIDTFLDITSPITKWDGITFINQGSFDFLSKDPSSFLTHLDNYFQLAAYDGSWTTSLSSKSTFSLGIESMSPWSQEFIIKNPVQDLEKIAQWIQIHWTDKLSVLLNMPSIKYYGDYFPKYFVQALMTVMMSLGEIQEDGTMSFKMTSGPMDSFEIGNVNISEIASLFVAKVKEKIGGWWN
jgi:hypothetical protein